MSQTAKGVEQDHGWRQQKYEDNSSLDEQYEQCYRQSPPLFERCTMLHTNHYSRPPHHAAGHESDEYFAPWGRCCVGYEAGETPSKSVGAEERVYGQTAGTAYPAEEGEDND